MGNIWEGLQGVLGLDSGATGNMLVGRVMLGVGLALLLATFLAKRSSRHTARSEQETVTAEVAR